MYANLTALADPMAPHCVWLSKRSVAGTLTHLGMVHTQWMRSARTARSTRCSATSSCRCKAMTSAPSADGKARVHCSLNINTETGRLSARRPNLQNQPALEKDRYKVSSRGSTCIEAFVCVRISCP